ncbi:MAG: hypothetical protein JW779_01300 [Candidatus Thorarchaeota archaeon]|nr:hypothetical protein [Candidatus Thorarchaeota archaeon]
MIKYLVLLGCQYSTTPIVDMRIQDINILADPNRRIPPPPFSDDCSSNSNFPLDNGFPWGVTTYGELSIGSSYLYPSAIPNSPSGWHGPNFVHVLNDPFRLGDLSEFSVEGELVQHSSQMGAINVALFDENMQIVLMVYWGDAWAWDVKGYFHVAYYPQGESAQYDSTPTTTLSIHRTGKLWVHDGEMQYEIPGYATGSLGDVVNPERVITYVAIRAERYSAYTLSDLRVHQITVSEGLPTTPAPMTADGSWCGNINENRLTQNAVETGINFIRNNLLSWWALENFWPVCHLLLSFVVLDLIQEIHLTIDLIGITQLIALQVNGGPSFDDFLSNAVNFVFASIFAMLLQSAVVAINIFDMASTIMPGSPWCAVALGVAVGLTILAYLAPIGVIENDLASGMISHGTAAWRYFAIALMIVLVIFGWKTLKNVLGATTAVLLGVVFEIHLCGAGIWLPWIEEVSSGPRTKWGSVILLGALALFSGLFVYHLIMSVQG